MRRIAVVGSTGAGKTTLARQLAAHFHSAHVELDSLYWGPNWTPVPVELFRERVTVALAGDPWVCDGNYSPVRDIVWRRADTLVWLDYGLWLVMGRLARRTFQRVTSQQELWSGNREDALTQLFSRHSVFWWVLTTHRRHHREFSALIRQPDYQHLAVVRLTHPKQAASLLTTLT